MKNEVYVIHLDGIRMSQPIFATFYHVERIAKQELRYLACEDLRAKGWTFSMNGSKTITKKAIKKAVKKHIGRITVVKYIPSDTTYIIMLEEGRLK